jgi:hypothetical protein
MAAFNKFNSFVEAVAEGSHNLGTGQLVVALTNSAPAAGNTQLSDITQIAYTNLSSRNVTTSSSSQTSGVYRLICADLTLTASGNVATFRYVVLYNDTSTNDLLIGWYDYGSSVSMVDTDTFLIDFNGTDGVISLS